LCHTIQHRAVLIIFPLNLLTEIFTNCKSGAVMHSFMSVSVSVCPVSKPSLRNYSFGTEYPGQVSIWKSSVQDHKSMYVMYLYVLFRLLTSRRLGLKTSIVVCRYIFRTSRSRSSIKVMGQGHTSVTSIARYIHGELRSNFVCRAVYKLSSS